MKKDIYKFYKKHGYLISKNILKPNECKIVKKILLDLADKNYSQMLNLHDFNYLLSQIVNNKFIKKDKISRFKYLNEIKKKSTFLKNVYKSKKITKIFDTIYKKEIVGLQTQVIYKKPKSIYSKQSFELHQDNSYVKNPNGNFFTAHIFLDDATKNNGTIYLYKDSHRGGLLEFKPKKSINNPKNPGNKINLNKIDKNYKKIDVKAKIGDLLIMHGHLIHGSYPNKSKNKSRITFTLCGLPKNEKFKKGYNAQRKVFSLR